MQESGTQELCSQIPGSMGHSALFRIKGCRWEVTYKAKFDKHELYNYIKTNVLRLKRNPLPSIVYIGHLTQNGEGYTRVLIKLGSAFDCKDKDRFVFFGVTPFIRAIYKKMWTYTVNELASLDRDMYPIGQKILNLDEENKILGLASVGAAKLGTSLLESSEHNIEETKNLEQSSYADRIDDLERTVLDAVKSINYLHICIEKVQEQIVEKMTELKGLIREQGERIDERKEIHTAECPKPTFLPLPGDFVGAGRPEVPGKKRSAISPIRVAPIRNPDVGIFFVNFGDASELSVIKSKEFVYETKSVILMGVTREWNDLKEKLSMYTHSTLTLEAKHMSHLFINIMDSMLDRCNITMGKVLSKFYHYPISLIEHPLKFNLSMLKLDTERSSKIVIVNNSDINFIKREISRII
jgi:vacuolar-type H+-ATPase subunit F/Vma7